ncbi:MAG: TerB family tellurite resistance protein [Prolixibacteraceae bacterium]|nr:TerB family tellurite resistance protein [Burkholderiales bacterium]
MFIALKNLIAEISGGEAAASAISEQQQLRMAVAVLLHEMMRVDSKRGVEETQTAIAGLVGMFGLPDLEAKALLDEAASQRLTSYFNPASTIKRLLSLEQRSILVENLWRVAFSDAELDVYEDQFVRKIADLLYVPNTECMLARQRAKNAVTT